MDTQNPPTAPAAEEGRESALPPPPAPSALDFRQLFESTPDPYLVVAPDFTMLAMNDAFLRGAMRTREQRMREQEQAEAALREKEELLRAVIRSLTEGVTVQDAQGVLRLVNASAERLLGLSQPELTGRVSADPQWGGRCAWTARP